MKTREINIRISDGVINATDGNYLMIKEILELSPELQIELHAFCSSIDEVMRKSKPILDIPTGSGEPVYTMIKPCPVNSDLTVNIYDTNYSNDKRQKIIKIDVRAIHLNSLGERVPEWDCDTYVLADMSEENRIEVAEGVYEYSYVLADTFLQQGMSIPQLIAMASQIADVDGSLNKRIYNI